MGWDPLKKVRKVASHAGNAVFGGNPTEKASNFFSNPMKHLGIKTGSNPVDGWSPEKMFGSEGLGGLFEQQNAANDAFAQQGRDMVDQWYNERPELAGYGDNTKIKDIDLGQAQTIDPLNRFDAAYGRIQDVKTGDPYQQSLNAFSDLQSFASSEGPSNIAQAQLDFQNTQQQTQLDNAQNQAASSAATAFDNLALTGGASSGARERLLDSASQNEMNQIQGINNQGVQSRQGIIAQDEARKFDTLSSLPGMGQALDAYKTGIDRGNQAFDFNRIGAQAGLKAQDAAIENNWTLQQAGLDRDANTFNANTAIRGVDQKNMYDQEGWRTKGDILGSNYTADAMLRSQPGPGSPFSQSFQPLGAGGSPVPGLPMPWLQNVTKDLLPF